jgi:hypothetical protein
MHQQALLGTAKAALDTVAALMRGAPSRASSPTDIGRVNGNEEDAHEHSNRSNRPIG